ncbi:hypothetical protein LXL04_029553 [Taraxacum kok-saghyz]
MLSIGGRAMLISSILEALRIYYMSLFPMPVQVRKTLESLRAKLFWVSASDELKIHWVSWEVVIAPRDQDGFGIGSLEAFNANLIMKWRWRFHLEPDSLWVTVIMALHQINDNSPFSVNSLKGIGMWAKIVNSWRGLYEKGVVIYSTL